MWHSHVPLSYLAADVTQPLQANTVCWLTSSTPTTALNVEMKEIEKEEK